MNQLLSGSLHVQREPLIDANCAQLDTYTVSAHIRLLLLQIYYQDSLNISRFRRPILECMIWK